MTFIKGYILNDFLPKKDMSHEMSHMQIRRSSIFVIPNGADINL